MRIFFAIQSMLAFTLAYRVLNVGEWRPYADQPVLVLIAGFAFAVLVIQDLKEVFS